MTVSTTASTLSGFFGLSALVFLLRLATRAPPFAEPKSFIAMMLLLRFQKSSHSSTVRAKKQTIHRIFRFLQESRNVATPLVGADEGIGPYRVRRKIDREGADRVVGPYKECGLNKKAKAAGFPAVF